MTLISFINGLFIFAAYTVTCWYICAEGIENIFDKKVNHTLRDILQVFFGIGLWWFFTYLFAISSLPAWIVNYPQQTVLVAGIVVFTWAAFETFHEEKLIEPAISVILVAAFLIALWFKGLGNFLHYVNVLK